MASFIPFQPGNAQAERMKAPAGKTDKKKSHHGGASVKKHGAPPFGMGLAHSKKKHKGHAALQKAAGRRLFGNQGSQGFGQHPVTGNNMGRLNA